MGVVYAARDTETGSAVALKTLPWPEGEEIYKLKREFRVLADLAHPNLVRLLSLHATDDSAWFTMELIEGRSFVEHARAGSLRREDPPDSPLTPVEYDALRGLVRQLVEGVHALHTAGRLHRDIKPSNVLVAQGGRVVLLDFGLASTVRTPVEGEDSSRKQVVGTIAYMSPEQGWAAEVGPAADWYAVGVMLYEALTGRRPFEGPLMKVLADKQARRLEPPAALVPATPDDLNRLVLQLLDPEPSARPGAAGVLTALGVSTSGLPAPDFAEGRARPALLGRDAELAALAGALGAVAPGAPQVVALSGEGGMGKTTLVEHFLDASHPRLAAVLSGRCHPREDVAFQGLDGIVDALSRRLLDLPAARRRALLSDLPAALSRVFPVLRGVPDLPFVDAQPAGAGDAARRDQGLAGLRRLLTRLAREAPVALWVDDLQWAEIDTALALDALLRGDDAPAVLLVVSFPTADEAAPAVSALAERWPSWRRVTLGPLSPGASRGLVERLLAEPAEGVLDAVVAQGAGSPFAVTQLARHVRTQGAVGTVEDALAALVFARSAPARRLLEVLCVAEHPLPAAVAGVAALVDEPAPPVQELVAAHLARATADGRLQVYHRRVRAAVASGLAARQRAVLLDRIASAYRAVGLEPASLTDHLARVGHAAEAADLAIRAGIRARQALAFHLASTLFRRALGLLSEEHDGRWELLDQYAEALARAGRCADAGASWAEAADRLERRAPGDPRVQRLRRQSAEEHLRAGGVGPGLALLDAVLGDVGLSLPASPNAALRGLVWERVRLRVRGLGYRPRAEDSVSADRLHQIDTCWTAAMGLCWVDTMRSAYFQCRYTTLALRAGEPDRVSRALATEAAFAANEGGASNRRRSDRALAAAREAVRDVAAPQTRAIVEICDCAAGFFSADFRRAVAAADVAESLLAQAGQAWTWEALNAYVFGMWSRAYLGDLEVLRVRVPALLDQARDRGDRLTVACLSSGVLGLGALAEDRPALVQQRADDAMALWDHGDAFHTQHYMNVVARVHLDLYAGRGGAALARIEAALPRMKRAMMLRLQYLRMESTWIRGRAAVGALASGDGDAQALARAIRADARALAREDLAWGAALGASLEGGLALQEGRTEDAQAALQRALSGFEAQGMALHVAATQLLLGRARGGEGGEALVHTARAWLFSQGVRRPDTFARVIVPG